MGFQNGFYGYFSFLYLAIMIGRSALKCGDVAFQNRPGIVHWHKKYVNVNVNVFSVHQHVHQCT